MATPIDNKTTQKVKEAISRMVKSDQRCASVILEPESCEPTELMNATIARILPLAASFKSGKTDTNIFMCDGGRVVLLVNYWEPPITSDESQHTDEQPQTARQQYIIIGVILAPSVHNQFNEQPAPVQTILDVLSPPERQNGALTMEFSVAEQVNRAYKQPVQLGVRMVPVSAAFKETDHVVQRFYEYMRQLGLIQDDPEDDMGALADAAGIEWYRSH